VRRLSLVVAFLSLAASGVLLLAWGSSLVSAFLEGVGRREVTIARDDIGARLERQSRFLNAIANDQGLVLALLAARSEGQNFSQVNPVGGLSGDLDHELWVVTDSRPARRALISSNPFSEVSDLSPMRLQNQLAAAQAQQAGWMLDDLDQPFIWLRQGVSDDITQGFQPGQSRRVRPDSGLTQVVLLISAKSLMAFLPRLAESVFWGIRLSDSGGAYRSLEDRGEGLWSGLEMVPLSQRFEPLRLEVELIETGNLSADATRQLVLVLLGVFLFASMVAVVLGNILARRLAEPFPRLLTYLESVSSARGSPGETLISDMLTGAEPLEITQFARKFDEILARLHQAQHELDRVTRERAEALQRELSRAQESLSEEKQRMAEVVEFSPDGYIGLSKAGELDVVNRAFERMTGLSGVILRGQSLQVLVNELVDRQDPARRMEPWELREHLQKGSLHRPFLQFQLREPWSRVLGVGSFPSRLGGGVIVFRDVTQEAQLDVARRDFWATAAHELWTPLTSIRGFCELLIRRLDAEHQPSLEVIHRQSVAMEEIVSDLLDLTRVEAEIGHDYLLQVRELGPILSRAVGDFSPSGARQILSRIDDHLPRVRVDEKKVTQVVNNLLSNADKYSPQGSPIEIESTIEQIDGRRWVGFRVKDFGIGMSAEEQSKLFRRFFRANPTGPVRGTGLGMALVREIVDQHRGRIDVVSVPERGSTFTVLFPEVD
jgi:signal transduction histidine kinase